MKSWFNLKQGRKNSVVVGQNVYRSSVRKVSYYWKERDWRVPLDLEKKD